MVGRTDEPHISGVEFAAYEPGPCIICGNSSMTCTSEDHTIIFEENTDDENTFIVEEDIIKKQWITPNHLAKVLIISAGTKISREKAEELGLL